MYITVKINNNNKTYKVQQVLSHNISQMDNMNHLLYPLYLRAQEILKNDLSNHYKTYYKTKHSGKKRRIDVPNKELSSFMQDVLKVFSKDFKMIFPKDVYGYVKGKSTKDVVQSHQKINPKLFLKLDITDFFGSCNYEFVSTMFKKVFPFCLLNYQILEVVLKACMYDDFPF